MSQRRDRRDGPAPVIRAVRLEDGGVIIYDADNEDAWLQAEDPVRFE